MIVEPRTLAGFMELLPNEQILFEQMKQKIELQKNNFRRRYFRHLPSCRSHFFGFFPSKEKL